MPERERRYYPWLLLLGLVVILVLLVIWVGVTSVKAAECPNGRQIVANVWSLEAFPDTLRKETERLIATAKARNTQNATDPIGYKGDAISRTLGARLRKEIQVRAPTLFNLKVFYRDLSTARMVEDLGLLRIVGGTGNKALPDDPRRWILETIWPGYLISPTISGNERRLWLFPEEWGVWCTMNVHGLVP